MGVNCTSSSVSLPSLFVAKYNFVLHFFRFPFGWEDKGTPGEGRYFLKIGINRAFIKIMGDIAYTVKPTGSLNKHSGDYINDALDSGGSLLYKVFINTLEKIAINAHIVKSARLNRNDGLDGAGSGLRVGFKAERSSGDGFKV